MSSILTSTTDNVSPLEMFFADLLLLSSNEQAGAMNNFTGGTPQDEKNTIEIFVDRAKRPSFELRRHARADQEDKSCTSNSRLPRSESPLSNRENTLDDREIQLRSPSSVFDSPDLLRGSPSSPSSSSKAAIQMISPRSARWTTNEPSRSSRSRGWTATNRSLSCSSLSLSSSQGSRSSSVPSLPADTAATNQVDSAMMKPMRPPQTPQQSQGHHHKMVIPSAAFLAVAVVPQLSL